MQQTEILTANDVELFLLKNPDFFVNRDRLVRQVKVPHQSGAAISLLEKQNELLRNSNQHLESRLDSLIANARNNDRMFRHLQQLVLEAVSCQSAEELQALLQAKLSEQFNVDAFQLLEKGEQDTVIDRLKTNGNLASALGKDTSYCGHLDSDSLKILFGSDWQCGSVAIASASYEQVSIIICLGNQDETYFRNSMDTLFLSYLADLTVRLLANYR